MKTLNGVWRESTTFKLCFVSWMAVFVRYFFGGLDFGFGELPITTAVEFGAATAAILAVWLGREWRKDHYAVQ